MGAALSLPAVTKVGRGIVYIASVVNVVMLGLAIVTVLDAKAGRLQAQQDLGIAVAIVLYGGAAALACLLTLLVGTFVGVRTKARVSTFLSNRIFWLGTINLVAPVILLLGMRWLLRG